MYTPQIYIYQTPPVTLKDPKSKYCLNYTQSSSLGKYILQSNHHLEIISNSAFLVRYQTSTIEANDAVLTEKNNMDLEKRKNAKNKSLEEYR